MKTDLNQLLALTNRSAFQSAIATKTWNSWDVPFTDTTGFHLYIDLKMELRISAGDEESSAKTLKILQIYTAAADAVCETNWLRILEVQGRRLHLYAECRIPDGAALRKLVHSCEVIYEIATTEISNVIDRESFNLRMAADYGRSILLRSTGEDVSESIVSLGPPANRPAKHLSREVQKNGVPAGFLALNMKELFEDDENGWRLFDLRTQTPTKSLNAASDNLMLEASSRFASMNTFSRADFEPNPNNPVIVPITRKGFVLRADLDGFSQKVSEAMRNGDAAILQLVKDFDAIMKYPSLFKDTLPKGVTVLMFPWAGDCANLFLQCDNYSLEQSHLPNTASLNWHCPKDEGLRWTSLFAKTQWLVAIAGGSEDAEHGILLTGNIVADGRTFHVGTSWSWQRSLDAEQADGNNLGDTVIQCEDYESLDSNQQLPYSDHPVNPTLFKKASLTALRRSFIQVTKAVAQSFPAIVVGTSRIVPPPRPYAT